MTKPAATGGVGARIVIFKRKVPNLGIQVRQNEVAMTSPTFLRMSESSRTGNRDDVRRSRKSQPSSHTSVVYLARAI